MLGYDEMYARTKALGGAAGVDVEVDTLGFSRVGRAIPILRIGSARAERAVLYVGTHHSLEAITAEVLLRFAEELAAAAARGSRIFNINVRNLLEMRRLLIVPMLDPDGVELVLHGAESAGELAETAAAVSHGDFSAWQANAVGVDLNHNYDADFKEYKNYESAVGISRGASLYSGDHPESEPETAALAGLVRGDASIRAVMALHTQGEEIYAKGGGERAAEYIARSTGYKLAKPVGTACFGGFSDYVGDALGIPALTLECGKGKNPLPDGDAALIYLRIREALVRFSTLY